jgi:hypothetical protein
VLAENQVLKVFRGEGYWFATAASTGCLGMHSLAAQGLVVQVAG